jgi:cell division GTPase FtsZ
MGSVDVTLSEINEATELVREVVLPGANIIFGADIRESMNEEIIVTIIATGFKDRAQETRQTTATISQPAPQPQPAPRPTAAELWAGIRQQSQQQAQQPAPQQNAYQGFGQPQQSYQQPQQTYQQPAQPQYEQRPATGSSSRVQVEDDFPEFLRKLNERNKR